MKTKVRITRDNNGVYKHLYFNFLVSCSYNDNPYRLEPAFSITWQGDNERPYWYGFDIEIRTDKIAHIEYALKVLKEITKECETKAPAEILAVLQAEQYVYRTGYYLPVSMHGCNEYKISRDGEGYKVFYSFGTNAVMKEIYRLQDTGLTAKDWEHELVEEKISLLPESIEV